MTADKLEPLLGPGGGHRKRGPYKPKSKFEEFLRSVIGGKYKWRRFELFEDYLIRDAGFSKEKATELIAKYQRGDFADDFFAAITPHVLRWMQLCRQDRASKAGKAKAKKHPKWTQERRKKFNLKKLERGT